MPLVIGIIGFTTDWHVQYGRLADVLVSDGLSFRHASHHVGVVGINQNGGDKHRHFRLSGLCAVHAE